jgi:hypothetical protein
VTGGSVRRVVVSADADGDDAPDGADQNLGEFVLAFVSRSGHGDDAVVDLDLPVRAIAAE